MRKGATIAHPAMEGFSNNTIGGWNFDWLCSLLVPASAGIVIAPIFRNRENKHSKRRAISIPAEAGTTNLNLRGNDDLSPAEDPAGHERPVYIRIVPTGQIDVTNHFLFTVGALTRNTVFVYLQGVVFPGLYLVLLVLTRSHMEFEITVDELLSCAAIDPYHKLIGRKPDDHPVAVTK